MKVKRDEFLQALESVKPGIATKNIIEQSDSFIFKDGEIATFDNEVSVRCPSGLSKEFIAAIPEKSLLKQLHRWKEEEIELVEVAGGLEIKGKGSRKAFFAAEKVISLPVDLVEKPSEWKPIDPEFCDAIKIVAECARDTGTDLATISISLQPEFVEASDDAQLARCKVKTGVSGHVLVRKSGFKHLPELDPTEMSEGTSWLHFRNPTGVVFSIRKTIPPEDYPDWTPYLKKEGEPIILPKSLKEEAVNAAIFSSEVPDSDLIRVDLKPGRLRVRGVGPTGWYEQCPKCNYEGKALSFMVSPKLLAEIVGRHHEAFVSEKKLLVDGGKFRSSICLEMVGRKEKE